MGEIENSLLYTDAHDWVRDNQDGTYTLGISDHAQSQLGEMVFIELPNIGNVYSAKDSICVVESVKAASDICAPCDLEVVAVNEQLESAPNLVNEKCYSDGYLITFKADDLGDLMDAKAYKAFLENE